MAATNYSIMNTIRGNASPQYQERIPVATRDNMTNVGNAILTYDSARNEFLNALINRISLVLISSKMAVNKLAPFKKGMLEYGADVEEIFVDMAKAIPFNVADSENTVFKRTKPDVSAIFHRVNREDVYPITIEEGQLKRAFLSSDGLGKLVAGIINSMYSADNYDEYVLMKNLIANYCTRTDINRAVVTTNEVTNKDTAQEFFRAVRQVSTDMTFMSKSFNAMGKMQMSNTDEQVLLLHKNVNTFLNTDLLAWVFNSQNIDFNVNVIVLDDFGTLTDTQAMLVDKNWFMVFDKLFQTTSQYNAKGLYWNYFLHHHQLLSYSLFHNAVQFKIPASTK